MTSADKAWLIWTTARPDMAHVGYHGQTADDNMRIGFLWDPNTPGRIPDEVLPLSVRQYDGHLPPFSFHLCSTSRQVMIDRKVRDLLLKMDPDAVWLGDIVFTDPDGAEIRDAYWLLGVIARVDALVPEESRVRRNTEKVFRTDGSSFIRDFGNWVTTGGESEDTFTLRKSALEGHHIWRLKDLSSDLARGSTFISDELLNALLDAGCEPFRRLPVRLI
ncbi:hypothetical protein FIU94_09755 [Sulfitobacter sp. THAF37]|uniref:imm11 family protein n=1 Tax=Sulfitobacter sp. THAF37 TaxID=2587855 RepID=UPI00126976AC|nr:DUF1629 domain-containing protein [Sulfitobacter sp. THAF37]QFT59108.1 hypothetical protein FIU94_09755 [Sulfitobacter sp. THAF37]